MSEYTLTSADFAKLINMSQSFMSMNMHKLGGQVQINGTILYSLDDVRIFLDLYNTEVTVPAKIGEDGKPVVPKKIYDSAHILKLFKIDKYRLNRIKSMGLFVPKKTITNSYYYTSDDIKYLRKLLSDSDASVSTKTSLRDFEGYTHTELAEKLGISYASVTLLINKELISYSKSPNGTRYFTEETYKKAKKSLTQYNDTCISPSEVARLLGVEPKRIKYLVKTGELPERRFINGWMYFLQQDVAVMLNDPKVNARIKGRGY